MVETRADVVEQLEKQQETMRLEDFVRTVERDHPEDGPGVSREKLAAYADAVYFDVDLSGLDDRLSEGDEWVPGERLYAVGPDGISVYPPGWHAALGDTEDVREIIELIETETTEPEGEDTEAVSEQGVPEEKVLRVAEIVAGIDRETARGEIKRLRQDGEIEEFASQHRNPTIRLS